MRDFQSLSDFLQEWLPLCGEFFDFLHKNFPEYKWFPAGVTSCRSDFLKEGHPAGMTSCRSDFLLDEHPAWVNPYSSYQAVTQGEAAVGPAVTSTGHKNLVGNQQRIFWMISCPTVLKNTYILAIIFFSFSSHFKNNGPDIVDPLWNIYVFRSIAVSKINCKRRTQTLTNHLIGSGVCKAAHGYARLA